MSKGIWFNPDHAKSLGKEKFIKEFEKVYPDADLAAEYDKVVPQEKDKKEKDK